MMPLAGGAPGHTLSAAILVAPAQCRWILGAPVQSLRIRLCAGGAAADRLRAGAPDSHGALAGGRSAPPGVRRGRGAVRRWIGTWCAERMVIGELMRGSGRCSMAARRWLPQFRVHHVLAHILGCRAIAQRA